MEHTKKAFFMMGSPAAGKSTIAKQLFSNTIILDSDEMKKTIKGYNPKKPHLVHEESSIMLEEAFEKAVLEQDDFVIDGTGANSDKLVRRITEAQEHGFKTFLIYVTCSLKTSLKRNSKRDRVVPESIVKAKYKDIRFSFEIVSKYADKVKIIDNE